jgi:hypothetical protein
MSQPEKIYDQIARAIGNVCILWATIEEHIHDLILHASVCIDPAFEADAVWDTLHTVVTNMELREKIATAKALIHKVDATGSLYDEAETLLNYIDNDLRLERNRYVHDYWDHEEGVITRVARGAKVKRLPPTGKRELRLSTDRQYEAIEGVNKLVNDLMTTYAQLASIDNQLARLAEQRERRG